MGNESEEGEETRKAMSRRKLLGLATAAAAGLALTPLTGRAHAETGVPLIIGETNLAEKNKTTWLQTMVNSGEGSIMTEKCADGFRVDNDGEGDPDYVFPWASAITGNCPNGVGVTGFGVFGVFGGSGVNVGVAGHSNSGIGVRGWCKYGGVGVLGETLPDVAGTGVQGTSKKGVGVHAVSETGTALKVDGKSDFNGKIGDPLIIGMENTAPDEACTVLNANVNGPKDAFSVLNKGFPTPPDPRVPSAILGRCPEGVGVWGEGGGHGVFAYCANGDAMKAVSDYGIGVRGCGAPSGESDQATGVYGYSMKGIGVKAESETGIALKVEGKGLVGATVDSDPEGYPGHFPVLHVKNHGTGGGILAEAAGVGVLAYGEHEGAHGFSRYGSGLAGKSVTGIGVAGESETGTGVSGSSKNGDGVQGWGGAKGVNGHSAMGIGVYGQSETGFGVFGTQYPQSDDFIAWYDDPSRGLCGSLGYSKTGKGVVGFSDTGIGVLAISKGSPALRVEGKSSFSTVGSGTIPRKQSSAEVSNSLVTDKSHITVTLTSNPLEKVAVSWIERKAGVGFTVYLTDKVSDKVGPEGCKFTYFIVEP